MNIKSIIPVLPSEDIERDVAWYQKYTGAMCIYNDKMYALLKMDTIEIHLQWHSGTIDDPINGGSVIRIKVEDIKIALEKFIAYETVTLDQLRLNTAWNTHEFGFFDLNGNAIFIMQSL